MTEVIEPIARWSAAIIELAGIAVIVGMALHTAGFAVIHLVTRSDTVHMFREVRQRFGRGILLGLEFLLAADIIHTVALELTFESVGVLAIIVVIRTFLSFTLEVELTGRWPWQQDENPPTKAVGAEASSEGAQSG